MTPALGLGLPAFQIACVAGEQAERAGHADDFAARYAASELRATNDAMLENDMAERQVSTRMALACLSLLARKEEFHT